MKKQFLKRLTLCGLVALLAFSFSSAALGIEISPRRIDLLTGWSYTYHANVSDVRANCYLFAGGEVSPEDMEWNGLTIRVNPGGTVYVNGSPEAQGSATIQVADAAASGDEYIVYDVAGLSIRCIDEDTPMPGGSVLSFAQLRISDKDGYHNPTYLRPLRQSLLEIPIVEPIDDDGYGGPDIMGVYVYTERDGQDTGKISLPMNSKLPGDLTADGYYYDTASNTFWVNYYTKQTGEYTFKFYYYQDDALRLQEKTLGGEIPGGDSGSGGCSAGTALAALALAAGCCIAARKR